MLRIGHVVRPRAFAGLGVQADCCIYDELNAGAGVNEADHALHERRVMALRPAIARVFIGLHDFNPSFDARTYTWESTAMANQLRNLRLLQAAGAAIHICMGPWTNRQMLQDGMEKSAVDLVDYLCREAGVGCIRWLSLFNEPDSLYAHDSPLYEELLGAHGGTKRPWGDYVEKHRRTLRLLQEAGLADQVTLSVPDTVWGVKLRYERLRLAAESFADLPVSYGFHHYTADFPGFYDHPASSAFAPPPLPQEIAAYRGAVGDAQELICWEFNNAGYGMGTFWVGSGPRGEDFHGSLDNGWMLARKVMTALLAGLDGLALWCLGDVLYPGGQKIGPMNFGLWRFKWQGWVPRPIFFYYGALMQHLPAGSILYHVDDLPDGVIGIAARGEHATMLLLNTSSAAAVIDLPTGFERRLRVHPDTLPLRPDTLARPCPEGDVPLDTWEPVTPTITLAPTELTILQA